MKSRVALERALTDRAQAALHVAQSGRPFDAASSIVLADLAIRLRSRASVSIVDDTAWTPSRLATTQCSPGAKTIRRTGEPRVELSRALRHSVDQLECGSGMEDLERARVAVQMTRRFHNNHVAQARRVRKIACPSAPLAGHAPNPRWSTSTTARTANVSESRTFPAHEWPIDDDGFPHRSAGRCIKVFNSHGHVLLILGHDLDMPDYR